MNGCSVGETHFFRHPLQFEHLARSLELESKPARIWSIGCANGAEPYTILLRLLERWPSHALNANHLAVMASDFNPEALTQARLGLYSEWHMRGCPPALRSRYFTPHQGLWRLDETIRQSVDFFTHDLVDGPDPPLGQHIIFCRNVLIYLQPEAFLKAVERLYRWLRTDGLLYLGYSEAVLAAQHPGWQLIDPGLAVFRKRELKVPVVPPPANPPTPQPLPLLGSAEALRLVGAASHYAESDQPQKAQNSLRQSLYLDPTLAVSHYRLGLMELADGHLAEARRHWRNVLELAERANPHQNVPGWEQCSWRQLLSWTQGHLESLQ